MLSHSCIEMSTPSTPRTRRKASSTSSGPEDEIFSPHSHKTRAYSLSRPRGSKLSSAGSSDSGVFAEVREPKEAYRVLVLGASGVGKTSLIKKFFDSAVPQDHLLTLQEMYQGEFEVGGGAVVKLSIEDTGGGYHADFPAMAELSLRQADGLVLVFSLDRPSSFEEVGKVRDWALKLGGDNPSLPTVVVGTKQDLERVDLPFEEIEATVSLDWECGYVECSGLQGSGVVTVFKELQTQALLRGTTPAPVTWRKKRTSSSSSRSSASSLLNRLLSREDSRGKLKDSCRIS